MAPFKSTLARSVGKLLGVYKDADLSLRGVAQSSRVPIPPFVVISATGGSTFTPGDGYKYHIYTNAGPNPFNVTDAGSPGAIEYVLIAGGGGGADRGNGAGGGGAGGVFGHGMELPGSAHQAGEVIVTVQNYDLVIGEGGLGAPENSGGEGVGSQGSNSTGFSKIAVGGGGGGQGSSNGGDGGSGGGGDNGGNAGAGQNYPGPTQQGFPGGEANEPGGGGGGGAASIGFAGNANPNPGGGGFGIGFSWSPSSYGTTGPDGSKRYFAGGGQGGDSSPGDGGYGGGGDMRSGGANGTGGGAGSGDDSGSGGTGGSGFIAVRYRNV